MAGQPFSSTGPHAQDAEVRIDVSFPLTGPPVPLDHGYALYAALCERRGELHGAEWLAVHPLPGTPRPDGTLDLGHDAALRLRVPPGELTRLLGLSGAHLVLQGRLLRLGAPRLHVLAPAPALVSRMVVIKGFTEPAPFHEALVRHMDGLGLRAQARVGRRRVLTIDGRRVVGFAVALSGLAAADSLRVQYRGLGGRQRMGCGVFVPGHHL